MQLPALVAYFTDLSLSAVLFTVFGYILGGNDYFAVVNFEPLVNIFKNFDFNSIFNYKMFVPNSEESFIFLRWEEISKFDEKKLQTALKIIAALKEI